MFQILHFSDLHLERPFKTGSIPSSYGTWRRQDLRATLGRVLTLAREKKVDVVTIAGDLFEQVYVMPEMAGFLSSQFSKAAPIRLIITPGENDPYTIGSLYELTRWPENVTVIKQSHLTKIELTGEITLWGAACPPMKEEKLFEDLNLNINKTNILLLHAYCTDSKSQYNETIYSIELNSIREAGFNFALLGSSHQSETIPIDAPVCAFPGSPEPFDYESENGGHHLVLLNIKDGMCSPELIPISRWGYLTKTVHIKCDQTESQVISTIEKIILKSVKKGDDQKVIQIKLIGDPDLDLNIEQILSQIKTKVFIEFVVDIPTHFDLDKLAQEQTVRGTLVKHSLERVDVLTSAQEREKEQNALMYALQALEGRQIRPL